MEWFLRRAVHAFAKAAGGHAGDGAEHLGEIIVIADANGLGHGGYGHIDGEAGEKPEE